MPSTPKKRIRTNTSLWAYLDSVGVLEKGTEDEIKTAKRNYWKKYFFEYKKSQRQNKPEFSIGLSRKKGEYKLIADASKKHKQTITAFIKNSSLAYINKKFLVPDKTQIAKLELLLMQSMNEIQRIARKEKNRQYYLLQKQIQLMQKSISEALRNPIDVDAKENTP